MDMSEVSHLFSLRAVRRGASITKRDYQLFILPKGRILLPGNCIIEKIYCIYYYLNFSFFWGLCKKPLCTLRLPFFPAEVRTPCVLQ